MMAKTLYRPILTAVFGALVLLASAAAFAATPGGPALKGNYLVKTEIFVDGKIVSSPRFIVKANALASIEMDSKSPASSLRMTMTAQDFANATIADGIDLKIAMVYVTPTRSIKANPRIVVLPGEEGSVTVGNEASGTLEMRVIAERQ